MTITVSTSIKYQPFCDRSPARVYSGHHLPHLRQEGCTYFVTFRLADSIPTGRLNQWKQERRIWLAKRGIDDAATGWRLKFSKLSCRDKLIFERNFASNLFESLDEGLGECTLADPHARKLVVSALNYFDGDRFFLGDFVVMPNHVHALITPKSNFELESILHSIKSWSSKEVNRATGRSGKLWMPDSYDRLTRDTEELLRTQEYIRSNPKKAGIRIDEFTSGMATYSI